MNFTQLVFAHSRSPKDSVPPRIGIEDGRRQRGKDTKTTYAREMVLGESLESTVPRKAGPVPVARMIYVISFEMRKCL